MTQEDSKEENSIIVQTKVWAQYQTTCLQGYNFKLGVFTNVSVAFCNAIKWRKVTNVCA